MTTFQGFRVTFQAMVYDLPSSLLIIKFKVRYVHNWTIETYKKWKKHWRFKSHLFNKIRSELHEDQLRVPTWDVLTPGASEAPSTHTGSTFRVTKSLVITVTEKLTVRTILSLLAHWRTNKSHYFFSDCLVIIHVLKLSIFLKATNIKSDGIKFSREKGWGAIEYKKKIDTKFLWLWFKRNFSQEILTIRAIGPLQSNRAEALPCHMITVGGATLTLLYTPRSIEPSWTHWNLNHWLLLQNPLEHAPCVGTYNQALFCSFK